MKNYLYYNSARSTSPRLCFGEEGKVTNLSTAEPQKKQTTILSYTVTLICHYRDILKNIRQIISNLAKNKNSLPKRDILKIPHNICTLKLMSGKKDHKNKSSAIPAGIYKQNKTTPETLSVFNTFISGFRLQAFIIVAIAFVFYYNTCVNEYALDDVMVIQQNDYVHQGFKGIPGILSEDTYAGYYKHMNTVNQFSGGRYRPLSVVTFAIEEELLGKEADENPALGQSITDNAARYMHTRHVVNVLLYMLSVVVFLYLLRSIVFKTAPLIAFLAALLFTIHPIHTEVVANIKSRDEILSFLFICLTIICAYRYKENNKVLSLISALACYILALLSKEYAITLVLIIPLIFYVFRDFNLKDSVMTIIPYALVLGGYLLVRFSITTHKAAAADNDLQNNPYLYATAIQKITTEIATLLNYLKLLFIPYPLSADYSFSQIPFSGASSLKFWVSLSVHIGLVIAAIKLLLRRNVLGFAIVFYLLNLLLVSNMFFNLGATMGERLIYHSSAGFAIAISWLLFKGAAKIKAPTAAQPVFVAVIVLLTIVCGYEVIARNVDWKNTNTLFAKDVQTVPNSFLANGIAGVGYCATSDMPENKNVRLALLQKGITYLNRSIQINRQYVNGYYNRALAYNTLGDWDKELNDLDSVKKYKPDYPDLTAQYVYLYHDKGMASWKEHKYDEAITAYKEGCKLAPNDPEMWYMLGITYYTIKDYSGAIAAWDVTLKLNPNHKAASTAYTAAQRFIQQGIRK